MTIDAQLIVSWEIRLPRHPASAEGFLHPLHAILLAYPIAAFSGALAADIVYLNTAVMQWSHFSAWLIAGGLLVGAIVLVWSVVQFLGGRGSGRHTRNVIYLLAVAIMWGAGLINAFQHSRDAWSSVGTFGLILSVVSTVAALIAGWVGFSAVGARGVVR